MALVLLILDRTASPALAGATVSALALPSLVTGPLLGAWLDRSAHRRMAFVVNQALLSAVLVTLLIAAGRAPSAVVILLSLLAGLATPVLTGGFTGLIRPLVPTAYVGRAYAAEATSYNLAAIVGPGLAGALSAAVSPAWAVAVSAALSGVALVAVLRVPMPYAHLAAGPSGLLRAVSDGLRLLARTPPLRAVTVATSLSYAGFGGFPVIFPLLALELGSDAGASGLLFAAFALGALVGSAAVAPRLQHAEPLRTAFSCILLISVVFAALSSARTLALAMALILVAGVVQGPVQAATLVARSAHAPAHMLTQVMTTAASIKFGAFAAGSAATGVLVASAGVRAGVMAVAALQVLAVLCGLLTSRGRSAGDAGSHQGPQP